MRLFLLFFTTLFMMSCNLWRNSKTEFKEEGLLVKRAVSLKEDIDQESREEWSLSTQFKDSLNHKYTIEIWPKGNFSFNEHDGFSGAASKVFITGDRNRVALAEVWKEGETTTKKRLSTEELKSEQLSAKKEEKLKQYSPSWIQIVVLLLGVAVGIYLLTGRLKS